MAAAAHDTEPSSPTTAASSVSAAKSEFLKLFWTLAESDVATRTRAAAQLLAYLRDNADDVEYTLKRLVRGLASSRDAARQGFSAALAALLVEFPDAITLDATLQLLQDAMEVSASMKAMEQREHMFGKLFGLLALQRSGRLARDEDATVAVLTQLAEMSKWKKWLREACVEAMLTVLSDVPKTLFVARVAVPLGALLEGDVAAFNADQVALAVGLHHYIQAHKIAADALPADYPALHFVRRKHMHALVEPLKHSTACFPRVHGAWYGLFGHIMHAGSDGAKLDSELFQEAWTVLVENVLLHAATTTHERKGLALKLFELVLPALPSAVLRAILTPNLVKCLFNNTLSKKTYLHDAARHTLKAFATHAPAEFFHFFQREFVQPMPALVEGAASDAADDDELKAAVKSGGFDAIIAIEEERERQAALLRKYSTVRLWALEHLVGELTELINGEPAAAAQQLRDRALEFLSFHAFFKPSAAAAKTTPPTKKNKKSKAAAPAAATFETPAPALSSQVREALVKKLFSLLSVKLSSAEDATLSKVFSTVFGMIETGSQELRAPLDDAQRALVASVQSHVASLRAKAADAEDATDDAFALLFQSCALQVVDASQREDAQGVVADLEKCFVNMQAQKNKGKATKKSPSKKSKKKTDTDEEAGDDERSEPVDAVVVLTDLLLSLLSQDSSAMREIVTHVFRDLVPLMTPQSLQTLVAALAPSAAGEDDEEKPEGDDDEEGDEDMGEDDEEEEEEVVLSSAADIADALRSDENLAELHREDQTLSAIVGQVKTKAKAKKDAKKHRLQVLHFKLRVVDLLALYASAVHNDEAAAAVRLVLPLFESLTAIASSDVEQRVLKDRLQAVLLHKFVRGAKEAAQPTPADRAECVRATQSVVELLSKKALDKELATKVGAAVVVHLMRAAAGDAPDAKTVKALQEIAQTAARDVFTKKHAKFPRAVFDELIAKHAKLAVHVLLPALTQIASASATESEHAAVDDFSKAEVFRLLSLLLKPKHVAEAGERRVFDAHRETLLAALVALLQHKKADDEEAQKSGASEMKAKRLKVFLSFALHLTRTWRELKCDEAELAVLVGVVQSLETSSPVVKNMVKQLSQAAGVEPADAAEPVAATPTKKQKTNAATANGEKKTKSKSKSPTPATSTKTKKSEKKKSPTPAKRKRSNSTADDVDDE